MTLPLLVTVDTEEEFDWSAPVSSAHRAVTHAAELPRLHDLFEAAGVRPTYVADHPILTDPGSAEVLRGLLRRGTCELGTHLHPWVNPPLREEVGPRNSYLANLPLDLQREKLAELTRAFRAALGVPPRTFKAGRYSLDFALVPALQELGYRVDTSVLAYFNASADGGPNFTDLGPEPFPLQPPLAPCAPGAAPLVEIPGTVGFNRPAFERWNGVHRALGQRPFRLFRPVGILNRLGILRKIALTPEGYPLPELTSLMRAAARRPGAVLNFTLHSPSIVPGHTPYVRTADDLTRFLATLRGALEYAVRELGATPQTHSEFTLYYEKAQAA